MKYEQKNQKIKNLEWKEVPASLKDQYASDHQAARNLRFFS